MKNILSLLVLLAFCSQSQAQSSGFLGAGSRASDPDVAAVHELWENVWKAYDSGDDAAMFSYYTSQAAEIGPDGNITFGREALEASWQMFMQMVDERPKFRYRNPLVRLLSDGLALIVWDSEADIKIGGQQIGGQTKGVAIVHKINGVWKVEFDSLTPIMPMPEEEK
ncbi:MAG: nuclear transport factor 2 family protein [Phaeodactylibacter sp.]|nr:nuclear transport factor 2 family protein [Phaeodactylibacter sp.]MCB9273635.1 nuclear transport factor 2 family protein [Lewinellaceae bacterium]